MTIKQLKEWTLEEDELMVSFDVKSLFTNVPIDDAMIILVENDVTLADTTAPTPTSICHLTELCLRSMYFAL